MWAPIIIDLEKFIASKIYINLWPMILSVQYANRYCTSMNIQFCWSAEHKIHENLYSTNIDKAVTSIFCWSGGLTVCCNPLNSLLMGWTPATSCTEEKSHSFKHLSFSFVSKKIHTFQIHPQNCIRQTTFIFESNKPLTCITLCIPL